MGVIEIPLKNSEEEVVEVDTTDLDQENARMILDILMQEDAPIRLFVQIAIEFYKRSMNNEFVMFLQEGIKRHGSGVTADEEKLLALNTLLSYYLNQASVSDKGRSNEKTPLQTCMSLVTAAERISSADMFTIIQKGLVYIVQGQLDQASYQFTVALKADKHHVPALYGQACVYSKKEQIDKALSMYQKILSITPDSVPDVRPCIGVCYYKLGMEKEARYAFSRALERNPTHLESLVYLSILDWNEANRVETEEERTRAINRSSARLSAAYTLDSKHPLVAYVMAERLFARRDYTKALVLAKYVTSVAQSKSALADAWFLKGKIEQVENDYHGAFESFQKAHQYKPQLLHIQYAYGQMLLFKGNKEKAANMFKSILDKDASSFEVVKRLAFAYCGDKEKRPEALECFEKLNTLIKNDTKNQLAPDPDVLIEFGKLSEETDPKGALAAYLNAKATMEKRQQKPSAELLNNIGALYHYEGNLANAKRYYTQAQELVSENKSVQSEYTSTTILYNIGRLYEAEKNDAKAQEFYKRIHQEHPAYYDSYIRLGAMQLEKGFPTEAQDYFNDVFAIDPKNIEAHLMLGKSHLLLKSYKEARRTYEKVLKDINSHNTYALCAVGNLNLNFARVDPKQKEIHYKRAFEFFDKALRLDNKNYVAAIGMGICLAERGQYADAKDAFTLVTGAMSSAAASVNLAHVLVELGQHRSAASLYEAALKRQTLDDRQDAYILQCMARAYYIVGKTEKEPEAMKLALGYIQKAVKSNPKDLALFYDMALLKQQYCHVLNEQPIEKRPLGILKKAAAGLEASRILFTGLGEMEPSSALGYDVKHATERANYCKGVKRVADKKIHETQVLEQQTEQRLEAIRQAQKKREEEQKEKQMQQLEQDRLREEQLQQKRREIISKMMEMNEQDKMNEPVEDRKKKNRDEVESGESGDETRKRKTKKKKKEESQDEPVEKSSKKRVIQDDSDDDDAKRRKVEGKKSNLSAAIIEDSDEDLFGDE